VYTYSAPPELQLVVGEPTYVEQVVRNLLTNAAKYSQSGSTIELVLEPGETEVRLRVLDRGIGVDAETAQHAFELFFRTADASRVASGAGIGLFVCRQLVDAMGGRIWIVPREGGGSEVGFSLPIQELDVTDEG
jgi:signal transduction histidine kinase